VVTVIIVFIIIECIRNGPTTTLTQVHFASQ